MPKKKEVIFQRSIPGKYIPRDGPPPINSVRSGVGNDNRFNSKIAELLASSAYNNNNFDSNVDNNSVENDSPQSMGRIVTTANDCGSPSSRVHSKLLHRRIVTMLETLRRRGVPAPPRQLKGAENMTNIDLQPITFGQLKATTVENGLTQPMTISKGQTAIKQRAISTSSVNSSHISRLYDDLSDDLSSRLTLNNMSDIRSSTPATTTTPNMIQLKSLLITDSCPDLSSKLNQTTIQVQQTKEQRPALYYSPSLEQLLNQHSFNDETGTKSTYLTSSEAPVQQPPTHSASSVDEIVEKYYNSYPQRPASVEQSKEFYIHPPPRANTTPDPSWRFLSTTNKQQQLFNLSTNVHNQKPTVILPPSILSNQNGNRPPPPSYSSSVLQTNRTKMNRMTATNNESHYIRSFQQQQPTLPLTTITNPSLFDVLLCVNQPQEHDVSLPRSVISVPPRIFLNILHENIVPSKQHHQEQRPVPTQQISSHPPPPRSSIERSHSALPAINRLTGIKGTVVTTTDSESQNTNSDVCSQILYDREFSRLLYGKDGNQRQKRKAYSDPVRHSIEEADRTDSNNLLRKDVVKEEDDDVDKPNENNTNHKQNRLRISDDTRISKQPVQTSTGLVISDKNTSVVVQQQQQKKLSSVHSLPPRTIVPANPLHARPIPTFLRVYSQAPSLNDILIQWTLFSLNELESFHGMMTKLFKDENLARVQLYETFRSALAIELEQKKRKSQADEEEDAITAL
ncbi:unnamed protein product [Didymodactylos carnosus]|nr:unnamed protein product [Didymodactylos carnosus]CAF4167384.1 unnamed protein product [Didymodactylos carnosus]